MIKEKLILNDLTFTMNKLLNEGDYLSSIQILQSLSSLLNGESLSDQIGLIRNDDNTLHSFPQIYGPMANYTGVTPVSI